MPRNRTRPMIALLRFIGLPVRLIAAILHCRIFPRSWARSRKIRRRTELALGLALMVGAATLDSLITFAPFHALTWLAHGVGATPVIERILLALEV